MKLLFISSASGPLEICASRRMNKEFLKLEAALKKEKEKGRPSKSDVLFFKSLVHLLLHRHALLRWETQALKCGPALRRLPQS